ncbi:hypothetical protein HH214_15670 [Mucilaginibacter robiniae]|uniref:Uncharacterized protein n=1 Tax=Mucilaginibacter robiniae TaxID=2728022 RepID=A0A7L5E211_9SPHI|nr:hypothetical protein [Mucilaginibacter robiniae]QJD97205.1 hypothetical protein HH214_15670 [Mucilaginibacter robiniae]
MMKANLRLVGTWIFVLCATLLLSSTIHAQPAGTTNFYTNIKAYNLASLWRADRLRLLSLKQVEPFPKPFGAVGKNYQRFYIHYLSVTQDAANPYRYLVQGKTRIGNQIRPFAGTITITQAGIFKPDNAYSPESYRGYKRGQLIAKVDFKEDSQDGGTISGKLTTNFCINAQNQLLYDTLDFGIDGYENNQFLGTIKKPSSATAQTLRWGDYSLMGTPIVDEAGMNIPQEYEKYGWQTFNAAIGSDLRPASKAAIAEEKRQWWK